MSIARPICGHRMPAVPHARSIAQANAPHVQTMVPFPNTRRAMFLGHVGGTYQRCNTGDPHAASMSPAGPIQPSSPHQPTNRSTSYVHKV